MLEFELLGTKFSITALMLLFTRTDISKGDVVSRRRFGFRVVAPTASLHNVRSEKLAASVSSRHSVVLAEVNAVSGRLQSS